MLIFCRARKKIVKVVERARREVALRKPFRTFAQVGKKTLIPVKKFYRQNREKGQEGVEKLKAMTSSVVKQAEKLVKSLYSPEKAGIPPRETVAGRGFDQSLESQKKLRKKWNLERLVIPRKGKTPHPDSGETWFRKALRKRTAIEPVICCV